MSDLTAFVRARLSDDANRVIREVTAKRAIMAEHDECEEVYDGERDVCVTLRALASIYSDHPDYQQEWAP